MELDWNAANEWQDKINAGKTNVEPQWKWDCNFKLDFDGGILTVESRFYPPHYNTGNFWEGTMNINLLGTLLVKKQFKSETLEGLVEKAEKYLDTYKKDIAKKLSKGMKPSWLKRQFAKIKSIKQYVFNNSFVTQ